MRIKIIIAILIFILCASLAACKSAGKTDGAEIDYGSSSKFSEAEIGSAVDAVLVKFKDFEGCELIKVRYDEERSDLQAENYMEKGIGRHNGVERENVIVLLSDFKTSSKSGASFNPDSTYTDWNWILIRNSSADDWVVSDWGY